MEREVPGPGPEPGPADGRQIFALSPEERQEIVAKLLDDIRTAERSRDRCRAVQTLATLLRLDLGQQSLDSRQPAQPDPLDARGALEQAEAILDEHRRREAEAPGAPPGRPLGGHGAAPGQHGRHGAGPDEAVA